MKTCFSRAAAAAAFVALAPAAAVAQMEAIDDVCIKGGRSLSHCECATDELSARLAEIDLGLYADGADAYLLRSDAGLPDEEAWAGAISQVSAASGMEEADVRARLQMAGALHRDAMRSCR